MSDVQHITVANSDDGQRLDRWLKKRMPFALAQKLIRTGQVRVDGKRAKGDMRLVAGQDVRLPPLDDKPKKKRSHKKQPGDADYIKSLVIYDDGDIVALNKPGDIASQGGGGVERHIDGLLEHLKDKKDRQPRLIHRLDRETSGVLLCARSPDSIRKLGKSFMHRKAQKIYWAVLVPAPEQNEGTVKAPLAKGKGSHKDRMYVSEDDDAKMGVTDFKILERAAKKMALVAFWPRTGRTHQLRVHASDVLECPILGDSKYSREGSQIEGQDLPDILHLHAWRLVIPHPKQAGMLDIMAPVSPDFEKSCKILGFDLRAAETAEDYLV